MQRYLGIDLGGTTLAAGLVDENGHILSRYVCPTHAPRPVEEIVAALVGAVEQTLRQAGCSQKEVSWCGVGSPGLVDAQTGVIAYASNLQFEQVPLRRLLQKELELPVFLENDANTAVLAETLFGAAKGRRNVLMVTLGTGVGSGLILDGRIYSGFGNAGAELGHIGMNDHGPLCRCGRRGCAELYCSATALIGQTREAMKMHPESALWQFAASLETVTGRTAFEAMRAGDETAAAVVAQYLDYLGYLLTDASNLLAPEVILLGGGISKEGSTLLKPLNEYLRRHALARTAGKLPEVRAAVLGNDAGLVGAAFLGKSAAYT